MKARRAFAGVLAAAPRPHPSSAAGATAVDRPASQRRPAARQAVALQPGIAPLPRRRWRGREPSCASAVTGSPWSAPNSNSASRRSAAQPRLGSTGVVRSTDTAGALSAGKRIVAWYVGYGFRPNDVVEQRDPPHAAQCHPRGPAAGDGEHFDASTACRSCSVNPTKPREQVGADEAALAARVYRRDAASTGTASRAMATHTGASIGAAGHGSRATRFELHGSLRCARAGRHAGQ